jgi:hypothetical protein
MNEAWVGLALVGAFASAAQASGASTPARGLTTVPPTVPAPVPPSSIGRGLLVAKPGDTLSLAVGGKVSLFRVSPDGIWGQGVALRRSPGRLRGRLGGASVQLLLAAPNIKGALGGQRVSLDVLSTPEGLHVAGQLGRRAIALDVRMSGVHGEVGACSYRLALALDAYAGEVDCGGRSERVRLEVPAELAARADDELVAMLLAVLAR